GEWRLGGVEAKGFACVALLLASSAACRGASREAGIEAEVAISFHPVIGVWGLASLVGAGIAGWCMQAIFADRPAPAAAQETEATTSSGRAGRPWHSTIAPALLCLTCSLPGVMPAITLLTQAPSRDEQRQADKLQVF